MSAHQHTPTRMSLPNPTIFTHPITSLVSRSRFTWKPYQTQIFENFIRDNALTSCDCQESSDYPIDELLVLLDLDGYGGYVTDMGECVMDLIREKVKNKLRRVEMRMRISLRMRDDILKKEMGGRRLETDDEGVDEEIYQQ